METTRSYKATYRGTTHYIDAASFKLAMDELVRRVGSVYAAMDYRVQRQDY